MVVVRGDESVPHVLDLVCSIWVMDGGMAYGAGYPQSSKG